MKQQGIHYFPGHMNKALKDIAPYLKVVDMVLEIVDARAPLSSRNPILSEMIGSKSHLLLLSKTDWADPTLTKKWAEYFEKQGLIVLTSNLKKDKVSDLLKKASQPIVETKRAKEKKIGMKPQPIRIMVVGVPNVGKSTFINSLAGKRIAIVGNKAGVTRSEQWIKLSDDFLLLDTPGVLPMNYLDAQKALRLAILGSMKEEVLPTEDLALALLGYLKETYPYSLKERFGIENLVEIDPYEALKRIALKRGYLDSGEPSTERAAYLLIKEFKDGILGRYSLEASPC